MTDTDMARVRKIEASRGRSRLALLAAGMVALGTIAGCDDESTNPEDPGPVRAEMTDDANGAAASPESMTAMSLPVASSGQAAFTGSFEADVQVAVSTDGETWVDLESPQPVTLDLQVDDAVVVHGGTEVAGGSYSHARVIMSGASVDLDAGASFNGTVFQSAVTIDVAGGSDVTIEAELFPFTVADDREITIVVDLNAEEWVTEATASAEAVSASEVQAAVGVEAVRTDE